MIKQYSLSALQKAMNHGLALDPATPEKIEALHGKILEMIISPLDVHFFMRFNHTKLELLAKLDADTQANTIIHSSPLGLIRLSLLPASKVRSLFNENIRMTGDTELGQQVKQLFDGLDIDWEGHLAHFTGDVVAHQLGRFAQGGRRLKQKLTTSMQQNVTEYLHEELRVLPPREELHDFMNDIDALSLRVERLAAHINQLIPTDTTTDTTHDKTS
jgi:ubiquinone biosynthesis accessory factor UbiJ